MSSKQLTIPGLELLPSPPKKLKVSTKERLANLESRVLNLELEVALLRIQLEGDKEHG